MFAAWLTSPKGTAPLRPPNSKILDHPGIVQNFLLGSLTHRQLAGAYVVSGDTAQAKAAYHRTTPTIDRRDGGHLGCKQRIRSAVN
jgi:hypothetical protein